MIARTLSFRLGSDLPDFAKRLAPDQLTAWEFCHLRMSAVNGVRMDDRAELGDFEFARAKAPARTPANRLSMD